MRIRRTKRSGGERRGRSNHSRRTQQRQHSCTHPRNGVPNLCAGIGRATAVAVANLGAEVIAVGRSGLDKLKAEASKPRSELTSCALAAWLIGNSVVKAQLGQWFALSCPDLIACHQSSSLLLSPLWFAAPIFDATST